MEGLFLSQLEGGATELDLGRKWLGDAGAAALATALLSGAGAELTKACYEAVSNCLFLAVEPEPIDSRFQHGVWLAGDGQPDIPQQRS